MKKYILISACLLLVMGFHCFAEGGEGLEEEIKAQMDTAGVGELDSLADGAREFDENFSFDERVREEISGKNDDESGKIIGGVLKFFFGGFKEALSQTAKIMLAVLIFGVILRFVPDGALKDAAFYAAYAVVFTIALFMFGQAERIGKDLTEELSFFVKGAVPVMCTLAVPSGQAASSAGSAAVIGGICLFTEAASRALMPLTGLMAALAAANNLSEDISLKGLEKMFKKIIMWCIGIVMTIFVSLLKVRGLTGAALDGVAGKTVKFAVGNFIPVVGGIISDSLDSIITCSRAIKSACGAVGIIALIYMIVPPLMRIGGMLAAFRLTGIITSPVADSRISGAIDNFADIVGLILTINVAVSILFITAMGSLAS